MMATLEQVFQAVAAGSWRAALLVTLLLVLRWGAGKYLSRQVLALFWLGIVLVALAPFAVMPAGWSPFNYTRVARMTEPMPRPAVVESVEPDAPPGAGADRPGAPPSDAVHLVVLEQQVLLAPRFLAWAGVLWLAGAGLMLLWQLAAVWNLRRHLRGLKPSDEPRLLHALEAARRELGLAEALPVCVTSLVATPALCGIWRPCLLFPPRFAEGLSAAELRFVMLHELGHWRRRDLWLLTLLQVARAVHWFNPALWLALRVARQDCELACDEFVLRHSAGDTGAAYGETLLKVLGRARRAAPLPGGVSIVENKRQLLKRFAMIMNYHPVGFLRAVCGAVLLGGFAVVGATQEKAELPMPAPAGAPTGTAKPQPPTEPSKVELQARFVAREEEDRKWEENAICELHGVGLVAGVQIALISFNGNLCAVTADGRLGRFRVREIDVEKGLVTLGRPDGQAQVLPLSTSNPIKLPELSERQVEFLLSKENAKRWNQFRGMPGELSMIWDKVSLEGQAKVLLSYLRSGLVVANWVSPMGSGGSSSQLLSRQMSERNKARRDAFIASLTPEQKERYGSSAQQAIRLTAPAAEREQQMVVAKAAKARKDEVIAGLTTEQRALYDEMMSWLQP